jgi:hypothetical protein
MPSIHRQHGKPNWVATFRVYDPQTNRWKQVLRSTFTRNKRQAQKICDAFDEAAKAAQNGPSDNPNAHIFPNAAKHKRTASLSNQLAIKNRRRGIGPRAVLSLTIMEPL